MNVSIKSIPANKRAPLTFDDLKEGQLYEFHYVGTPSTVVIVLIAKLSYTDETRIVELTAENGTPGEPYIWDNALTEKAFANYCGHFYPFTKSITLSN